MSLVYKALLIGNGKYDDAELANLVGTSEDVRVLSGALLDADCGLHVASNVQRLIDATCIELLIAIERFFSDASRNDQLLLYYTGHGKSWNQSLYLCARDTNARSLVATSVSAHAIDQMIKGSPSSRVVIVLDCCHAGLFSGGKGSPEFELSIPAALQGRGRYVLAAAQAAALAADAVNGSPFTRFLAEGLTSRNADADSDGYVSILELYLYVYSRLLELNRQIAQFKAPDSTGNLAIARRPPRAREGEEPSIGNEVGPSETTLSVAPTVLSEGSALSAESDGPRRSVAKSSFESGTTAGPEAQAHWFRMTVLVVGVVASLVVGLVLAPSTCSPDVTLVATQESPSASSVVSPEAVVASNVFATGASASEAVELRTGEPKPSAPASSSPVPSKSEASSAEIAPAVESAVGSRSSSPKLKLEEERPVSSLRIEKEKIEFVEEGIRRTCAIHLHDTDQGTLGRYTLQVTPDGFAVASGLDLLKNRMYADCFKESWKRKRFERSILGFERAERTLILRQ